MDEQTIDDVAFVSTEIDEFDFLPMPGVAIQAPASHHRLAIRPSFYGEIPQFPATKPLAPSDQCTIEHWAQKFPPVSDFNFVSLWSWNTAAGHGNIEVSWLNDNLVVLFKDYLSNDHFYSFLGVTEVDKTARRLLEAAQQQGVEQQLHLLPSVVISALSEERQMFSIQIDDCQTDYILSTEEWSTLSGGTFRKKRNAIHHLERTMNPEFRPLDAALATDQQAMHGVFGRWAVQSNRAGEAAVVLQATALNRVFSVKHPSDLLAFGVFIDGELRAFTINEALHDGYALGHFCYGDREMPGLYPFILRETCRVLNARGYRFLNTMQDLGQEGMKQAKVRSRPHHYLHKYSLSAPVGVVDGLGTADQDDLLLVCEDHRGPFESQNEHDSQRRYVLVHQ